MRGGNNASLHDLIGCNREDTMGRAIPSSFAMALARSRNKQRNKDNAMTTKDNTMTTHTLDTFTRLDGTLEQQQELLGPLAPLVGTWAGSKGWNLIAVPQSGSNPRGQGDFQLLIAPYAEILTFTPIGAPVLNRGGDANQFIGGLQYEQRVVDLNNDQPLHIETGMWLYLGHIDKDPGGEALPAPKFTIARSGTIPHGDSVLILGTAIEQDGPPTIPPAVTLPQNLGTKVPFGYTDVYQTASQPGLISAADLNKNLDADIKDQDIISTVIYVLDSNNEGAVKNVPFIDKHAVATRMQATFWVETVQVPQSKQTFQQLQYSQTIDMDFDKRFGGEPGLITWPHVNINTLKKQ